MNNTFNYKEILKRAVDLKIFSAVGERGVRRRRWIPKRRHRIDRRWKRSVRNLEARDRGSDGRNRHLWIPARRSERVFDGLPGPDRRLSLEVGEPLARSEQHQR